MNDPITPPDTSDYPMELNLKRPSSDSGSIFTQFPRPMMTAGETLPPLVNASVTLVPATDRSNSKYYIFVFGGFEQYSSELSNSLYRLDLETNKWEEVRYVKGTPPTKRHDHTASLWQGDKLIIFGGEGGVDDDSEVKNNDIIILDLKIMEWSRPEVSGKLPTGRTNHSATIHDNKLYIVGGLVGDGKLTSEMNILDLETWTWQPEVAFSARRSHKSFVFQDRLYAYGGYKEDLEREHNIAFVNIANLNQITNLTLDSTVSPMTVGEHFAEVCGNKLIVFISQSFKPVVTQEAFMGIWSLDLQTFQWQQYENGALFAQGTWLYFSMARDDRRCFFIGSDGNQENDNYFGWVLHIDLREYGICESSSLNEVGSGIGADLGRLLTNSSLDLDEYFDLSIMSSDPNAPPIKVHKILLIARWPHYANMISSGMIESRASTLTIPEPYEVVRAFITYLYTDSIANFSAPTVADLLVLGNLYLMPRLSALCSSTLHANLSVEHAAVIYHRASIAGEAGLKQRALKFIFSNFGAVGRTEGFRQLPRDVLMQVFDFLPKDASVVAGSPKKLMGNGREGY